MPDPRSIPGATTCGYENIFFGDLLQYIATTLAPYFVFRISRPPSERENGMPRKRELGTMGRYTAAEAARRQRRQMLRDWDVVSAVLPVVDAQFIKETREKLRCTRALFARRLCMSERTLEGWEQGRALPNSQAAVLLLLVRHYPDTLERLRRIAYPDPEKRGNTTPYGDKRYQKN